MQVAGYRLLHPPGTRYTVAIWVRKSKGPRPSLPGRCRGSNTLLLPAFTGRGGNSPTHKSSLPGPPGVCFTILQCSRVLDPDSPVLPQTCSVTLRRSLPVSVLQCPRKTSERKTNFSKPVRPTLRRNPSSVLGTNAESRAPVAKSNPGCGPDTCILASPPADPEAGPGSFSDWARWSRQGCFCP